MEIEIGNVFESTIYTFKVVDLLSSNLVKCEVYTYNRKLAITFEHPNTLFNMKKLTPLEKELM
jgi:hypothetical protein